MNALNVQLSVSHNWLPGDLNLQHMVSDHLHPDGFIVLHCIMFERLSDDLMQCASCIWS